MTKSVVLGIAGGTGSGKTTVAREIVRKIGADRIAYLSMMRIIETSVICLEKIVGGLTLTTLMHSRQNSRRTH